MVKFRLFGRVRAFLRNHPTCFSLFIALNLVSFSVYTYLAYSITESNSSVPFPPLPYLINTSTCRLKDYPMFDQQTRSLFKSYANSDFGCNSYLNYLQLPPFSVKRVNFTWIQIDYPESTWFGKWKCFAVEIKRSNNDKFEFGAKFGPLERLTNFASHLPSAADEKVIRWDAVKVTCHRWISLKSYITVVPLIQHYRKADQVGQTKANAQVNVLLLGIDSVSRLNFLRHMTRTKQFVESHGFVPMFGYHKIGENSLPNIIPILTGQQHTRYCNRIFGNCVGAQFKLNKLPLVFNDYARKGYLTTFIEDMPDYGFFTYNTGGYIKLLFDYYLRPVNLAILNELYWFDKCYQAKLESELYLQYVYDQMEAFRARDHQSFITMVHMSTLTHDEWNYAGFADKPTHHFLEQIFSSNLNQNTVILFYSDHAIRFGSSLQTKSHFYEERLPFFYLYLPESVNLSGRNASELRDVLRVNQHRLTSHFDLHATMLHLLNGKVPQSEPYGRSLLEPIPLDRTCDKAGIPPESCLCNSFHEIPVTDEVIQYSEAVVTHMNQMMASYGDYCVPLTLGITDLAFESFNHQLNKSYREVHFSTLPNGGHFKATLRLGHRKEVLNVEHITRTNRYGQQSHCVKSQRDLVQYCLCWDMHTSMSSKIIKSVFNIN